MQKKLLYEIKNEDTKVKLYDDGQYEVTNLKGNPQCSGSVHRYKNLISSQMNQLKAKMYNTIEAAITDKEQKEAVKGLLKGFCNDSYKNTVRELRNMFLTLGLINDCGIHTGSDYIEPLED